MLHKSASEESYAVFKDQEPQIEMTVTIFDIIENGTTCEFGNSSVSGDAAVLPSKDANKINTERKDASEGQSKEVNVVISLFHPLFLELSFHGL